MDKFDRMEELISILEDLNYHYYTLDEPRLSDREYDVLYDELLALEKETDTIRDYSPTQRVGGQILDGFEKHNHLGELWSLGKSQNYTELRDWDERVRKLMLDSSNKLAKVEYIVEYKFDGLSINLTYNQGRLVGATTRGNGVTGEAILENVKTIKNIPLRIDYQGLMEVQGEGLMPLSTLESYNKSHEEPLKNARNAAAGALRNLDPRVTNERGLIIYSYNIGYIEGKEFKSHMEMLEFLRENRLPVFDYNKKCSSIDEVIKLIEEIDVDRHKLDILTDGVVIKVDDMETRELLGYTMKFPRWAMAYKFEAEEMTTILREVVWNVGRTGKVTPSALVDPVEIGGATVRRATLNNYEDIVRKKLKINSRILIRRSNEVIPEIMGVVEDYEDSIEIEMPKECPYCHSEIVKDGVHTFCPNSLSCKPQLVARMVHFASRDAMNIEGFSEKTIEKLVEEIGLEDIADIYEIEYEDIIGLEGFKERKSSKLLEAIEKSKKVELHRFLYALGVPNVGLQTAKDLVDSFNSLDSLKEASYDDLINVDSVGPKIAESILEYFHDERILESLDKLLSEGVDPYYKEVKLLENSYFNNKVVVITGSLENYNRKDLKTHLEGLGAKVTGSVSKNTDYLIVGSSPGSKYDKAVELNIEIIDEKNLSELL